MKKIILIIIILFAIFNIGKVYAEELTNEQKALLETMDAYNSKGKYIQYDSQRQSFTTFPELATSQNTVYIHCSNFAFNLYKNALGMELFANSSLYMAHSIIDQSSPDVIKLWDKTELDTVKATYQNDYDGFLMNEFGPYLKIGDIFTVLKDSSAHTMLVYDLEYNNENKVTKVTLIEGYSRYEKDSTKLANGLSYTTNGGIRLIDSKVRLNPFLFTNTDDNYLYMSILRPLEVKNTTNENKYVHANCDREANANIYDMSKFHCTTEEKTFDITDAAKSRIKYSKMDIEKTVTNDNNIINGSDVDLNEEFIYNIKITNNSENDYSDLVVKEKISNYVNVVNHDGTLNNNIITWTVNIPANTSKTISYKVKVKDEKTNIGKIIESNGKVDDINTAPIKNKITYGFTTEDKTKLVNSYNSLKNVSSKKGLNFINEIYENALNYDLKLNKLKLDNLINNNITSNSPYSLSISSTNSFGNLVYNNYYGAVRKINTSSYGFKHWTENWLSDSWNGTMSYERSARRDTIYKEHFETGDILIYQNSNDPKTNEDGVYAFIFINNSFFGLNIDNKNEFSATELLSNSNPYLNTLLGKDYYVVLRPSYLINDKTTNEETAVTTDDTNTNKPQDIVVNPKTSENINKIILSVLLLVNLGIIAIIKKKKII